MKFVCERCQTKYSIADEKVRQKVLKIRCKTCENVITIRDAVVVTRPAASSSPARSVAPTRGAVDWQFASNGQQEGPFTLEALVRRIESSSTGEEVYVWNEHLDGWKEPPTVPEVVNAMRARQRSRRPSVPSLPVAQGRAAAPSRSGSQRAVAGARGGKPAPTPVSPGAASARGLASFDEGEDRTQIQPVNPAALLGEVEPAPPKPAARTPSLRTTQPVSQSQIEAPSLAESLFSLDSAPPEPSAPGAEPGWEGIPLPQAPSKPLFDLPAPAGNGLARPVVAGGSTSMLLSQVAGRVGRARHPAIKYLVTGALLVGLVSVVVALTVSDEKKQQGEPGNAPEAAADPAAAGGDPEAIARAEAEKYFKSMVPDGEEDDPSSSRSRTIRPRGGKRVAKGRGAPRESAPPPLTPPPMGMAKANVDPSSRRFDPHERRVLPIASGRNSSSNAEPDHEKFMAVIKKPDNRSILNSCYMRALKRDDNLKNGGRLEIEVAVGETGSVRSVRVKAPPEFSGVSACIRSAVSRWRFPPNGSEYRASFPLVLGAAG